MPDLSENVFMEYDDGQTYRKKKVITMLWEGTCTKR